ncbi:MAG TPA: GDSL-type esterase/lipase family protein [Opitutaceae bacterium]
MLSTVGVSGQQLAISLSDRAQSFQEIPANAGGRTQEQERSGIRSYRFQWPAAYFECAFKGQSVAFAVNSSEVIYHVVVDGRLQPPLVKPKVGRYEITGLTKGKHTLRIEDVTENSAPQEFGGFYVGPHTRAFRLPTRKRQIEFIGDSYMAGYGNTSNTRDCTPEQVWLRTDTSSSFPVLLAKHYNADYQVNAVSGRGIVRNYDGFVGFTIPEVYSYTFFDKTVSWNNPKWSPEIIWIDLGSNDFATPVHPNEKWKTRDELRDDFQTTYLAFVQKIRERNPHAHLILSASDKGFAPDLKGVIEKLKALGETKVGYMLYPDLQLMGCNWHLTLEDDQKVAGMMMTYIDKEIGADW